MEKITSHKDLAHFIQGKSIMLLNSLGKDAVLCLEWLCNYAKIPRIVSCLLDFNHSPDTDDAYIEYLKSRYPHVVFVKENSVADMNEKMLGMLQSPVVINHVINKQEYDEFNFQKVIECLRIKYNCDLIASGISCYEGMGRAIAMRRKGLYHADRKMIFPIGLMKLHQVKALLFQTGVKLNPCYKYADASLDSASYYKMRYPFIANPALKKKVVKNYPLIILDQYRYEVLFGNNKTC